MNKPLVHFVLALLVVVALPLSLKSGILGSEILLYGLAAAACNLLLGYTGLLSFGQGIFFGTGSYVAGILLLRTGLGSPFALLLGALLLLGDGLMMISRRTIKRQGGPSIP